MSMSPAMVNIASKIIWQFFQYDESRPKVNLYDVEYVKNTTV